jgi:hypothetical protein
MALAAAKRCRDEGVPTAASTPPLVLSSLLWVTYRNCVVVHTLLSFKCCVEFELCVDLPACCNADWISLRWFLKKVVLSPDLVNVEVR